MSAVLKFEGKSVENAVQKACDELKINRGTLDYEIISHGSSGIFGIVGARKAKIRVKQPDGNEKKDAGLPPLLQVPGRIDDQDIAENLQSVPSEKFSLREPSGGPEKALETTYVDLGCQILQKIVDSMTTGASISGRLDREQILLKIEGGNAAILIGKHGQTLEAMQYLVEKIINRSAESRVRLQIDVGGYLENRRENLRNLARRMAAKAKKNGKPVTIGQLRPQERRIVHLELRADEALRTQSVGEGFIRKLIIIPRKKKATNSSQELKA